MSDTVVVRLDGGGAGSPTVLARVAGPALESARVVALDATAPTWSGGGGGAATFDELGDVDAPYGSEGLMLRGPDNVIRPMPLSDVRTDVFTGTGPPPAVVLGAAYGDLYIDESTGQLWRLT